MIITFDSTDIYSVVDAVTSVDRPALPPKTSNLVSVAGRNFPYDFGNNTKQSFEITIGFVIKATSETDLNTKVDNLTSLLDVAEAKNLIIGANTYKAQIYGGVNVVELPQRKAARGTITFTCHEVV